ncbi:pseudouridine synthase [Hypoxylon sp. FL1284]|nr:pseudouridine synthase [Hypoxylon sp. FL1284]
MADNENMRDAPAGDIPTSAAPASAPMPESAAASTASDTAGPNRRDKRKYTENRKTNANGRRKGQGSSRGDDRRGPRDRRARNEKGWQERKRRKLDEDGNAAGNGEPSYMSIQFPEAEIAAEERRPKRKVAVMIGYAGTGYHGLQINHKEKTIEGDIFAALVAAKAISKANADDPRKSSFVRCARTDKGVHAAGNMISLKLIIDEPDLVKKINENLPPQIRVWGIQRTNNSFSCYQSCDSRWYEYLMPSYCLLPPHPESYLGKKVLESVKEKGVEEEYATRLGEVKDYWDEVQKNDIQPILDSLDPDVRATVIRRMHVADRASDNAASKSEAEPKSSEQDPVNTSEAKGETAGSKDEQAAEAPVATTAEPDGTVANAEAEATAEQDTAKPKEIHPVDQALKQIKAAYVAAKRRYRVTPERLSQLQQALDQYVGTRNYHNYTIQKSFSDPSSRRTIRSFAARPEPVQINDTQWLSLKVHGQSFMMHQIRKMVGMAVLVARCATPLARFAESFGPARISIPKAPSLGLLLERPVFESYNKRAQDQFSLAPLDYAAHEADMQAFKDEQIYRRIFELEEKENSFHTFFHQIDNYKSAYFLWVTAGGLEAAEVREGPQEPVPEELREELGEEDGDEDPEAGEG